MNSATKIKSSYLTENKVKLIRGGKEYFSLLGQIISNAKQTIQLQVYIFDEDETGLEISERLIKASQNGIKVQILLDGYASRGLSQSWREKMRESGVLLRFFEPILKKRNYYFGRRLHHKVIVIDGLKSVVGGINISNRYNDTLDGPAWMDWAIYIEGKISVELFKLCNQLYAKSHHDLLEFPDKIPNERDQNFKTISRIRRNDWVMNKHQISGTYMEMFKQANDEIIIMSSYFIPGRFFRRQIEKSLKRNIKIKIILGGMSDIGLSRNAEKYFYRWAFRVGLQIFEYKTNILHGKIAICDKTLTTIGSYNINDISALASVELNIDVRDKEFSSSVHNTLLEIIENECQKIEYPKYNKNIHVIEKFIQWLSYEFYRITFTLFTFYFKRRKI